MFDEAVLNRISFLTGNGGSVQNMVDLPSKEPFDKEIMDFLSDLSKVLMADKRSRQYSDVVTFAFWIRTSSLNQMMDRHGFSDSNLHLGRGVAFHIAPSNVPVNFAYSLVTGLLTGNANIVRIPGKDFPQVEIIVEAVNETLLRHEEVAPYIVLVRYGHDKEINDLFSSVSDTRIIWGGDRTIGEVRMSALPPRSTEITFADRYSIAIIDSDDYEHTEDKKRVAEDFYNDTYFSDQNACTSPRIVIWTGKKKEKAREDFWQILHSVVKEKYRFQDIQGVNKLTAGYLTSVGIDGIKIEDHEDNLLIRVLVPEVSAKLMDYKENSGFFFEYLCDDISEIKDLCNDKRCQTVGMIGNANCIRELISRGIKGIDRIVPIGKTMDFELIWDGYDLITSLTRTIVL